MEKLYVFVYNHHDRHVNVIVTVEQSHPLSWCTSLIKQFAFLQDDFDDDDKK